MLPLSPVGVAPYHLHWPGSLSIRPDTLGEPMIVDVCEGLLGCGCREGHRGELARGQLPRDPARSRPGPDRSCPLRVIVAESHVITNGLFPDEMEFTHAGVDGDSGSTRPRSSLGDCRERTEGDLVDRAIEGHASVPAT